MTDLRASLLARLDRALAICEAATPGPWACYDAWGRDRGRVNVHRIGNDRGVGLQATSCADIGGPKADFEFIAHARTAYPALLRIVRAEVEQHYRVQTNLRDNECACEELEWPCRYLQDLAAALESL